MLEWYWLVGSVILAFIGGHKLGWYEGKASGWINGWNQCQDGFLQIMKAVGDGKD